MKQTDRFEKVVDKLVHGSYNTDEMLVTKHEAVLLLRRQHRAAIMLVKQLRKQEVDGLNVRQYLMACDDILAALERRRGKR